jgi:Uma2 family endonuclease
METTIVLKDSFTRRMTDDEFLSFCLENSDLRIERNSTLEIQIMPPVSPEFSFYSGAAYAQLFAWTIKEKNGYAFDSSAGFTLPDRSVLSPDASWVSNDAWSKLSSDARKRFAPICPEFVIEVRSKSDEIWDLKKKMKAWIRNGAKLAWLIDPIEKLTIIYHQNFNEDVVTGFDKTLTATAPVEGFKLDLRLLEMK